MYCHWTKNRALKLRLVIAVIFPILSSPWWFSKKNESRILMQQRNMSCSYTKVLLLNQQYFPTLMKDNNRKKKYMRKKVGVNLFLSCDVVLNEFFFLYANMTNENVINTDRFQVNRTFSKRKKNNVPNEWKKHTYTHFADQFNSFRFSCTLICVSNMWAKILYKQVISAYTRTHTLTK